MPRPAAFRIIGGRWRGRKIRFASSVRASGDRVRESLFNCLGGRLEGRDCLDLFAGAGGLGLEAASRGARRVVCVERDRQTAAALRQTAAEFCQAAGTAAGDMEIKAMSAEKFLAANRAKFDLIFLDPPFADYADDHRWHSLLGEVAPHLAEGAAAYCESDRHFAPPPGWLAARQKKAGAVCWQLLRR